MTSNNHISSELAGLNSSLKAGELQGRAFTVPAGYFEGFAAQVMQRLRSLEVAEELETLSPLLAAAPKLNPYRVDAGYFQELGAQDSPASDEVPAFLNELKEKNPFSVPSGYFENLAIPSMDVDELTEQSELATLSPVLHSISRLAPYTLPAGYFADLDPLKIAGVKQVAEPLAQRSARAKVVSMPAGSWLRYAAAAVVVALVSTTAFFFINRSDDASRPDAAIAKTMKNVSTEEIDEVIDLADEQIFYAVNARDADQISKLIRNVPDKEIQDFLNDTEGAESDIDEDPLLN